jgi:CrcB protein
MPTTRASRFDLSVLLAIAAGGALGAPARYEIALTVHDAQHGFPWATFWTNIAGAFVLAVFLTTIVERDTPSRHGRPFFAIGFLGAFTTFSTLAMETVLLVKDSKAAIGLEYLLGSVTIGLAVALLGMLLARFVTAPRPVT